MTCEWDNCYSLQKLGHPIECRCVCVCVFSPRSLTASRNLICSCSFSDAGIYDRVVVQDVVKQMAQTQQINSATQRAFKGQWRRGSHSLLPSRS